MIDEIINLNIEELTEYENNTKLHPQSQIDTIKKSIEQFGFNDPIAIWGEGNLIIEGHGRLIAAKQLGISEVPCIRLDHLSDDERKAYTIAHNATSLNSGFDLDKLNEELKSIDYDMAEFGLAEQIKEIEQEFAKEVIEDEVPEVASGEPITQLGDIWQLGRSRLMCGDSTDALNYKHLTNGAKVDLVFTDPPYGMKKEADGVLNDNLNYDDLLEFNKQWIPLTFDALKDNGSWYCWGIDEPLMDIYSEILKPMKHRNEITFRNLITWDKGSGQSQNSELTRSYATADEKCLFVMCGVQGFNNNSDNYFEAWEPIRQYLASEAEKAGIGAKELKEITGVGMWGHWFTKSQWTFIPEEHYKKLQAFGKEYGAFGKEYGAFGKEYEQIKKEYEQIKKEYEQIKKEYYSTRAYFNNTHDNMNNVWHFDRTGNKERELTGGHATPKPIALCSRAIKSSSREGEIVLDVFGGSGSTLIACEQLNRTCYMMELDPKYVQVIIQRYIAFKGTSDDVYRINADGTKTKYADMDIEQKLNGGKI